MVPLTLIDRLKALFKNSDMKAVSTVTASNSNNSGTPEVEPQPTLEETVGSMVNSLALDSTQETLYLIDDGRCLDFSLKSRRGILIGTLKGQITVASAKAPPEPETDGGDAPRRIRINVSKGQWTTFFNEDNEVFGLIGMAEIDISLTAPKTQSFLVDLKENVITLLRNGAFLELTIYPKETSKPAGGTIA